MAIKFGALTPALTSQSLAGDTDTSRKSRKRKRNKNRNRKTRTTN